MFAHAKRLQIWGGCLLVVVATCAAYWQVRHFEFTSYDDEDYVTRNPMVMEGLTPESVRWAMTTTHFSYWHPLTWISHMLDVELFGVDAGKHHLTNVAIHVLATLALFCALRRLTGRAECSLVVAALFALHPLHVESVAWIAERKDVLSTLFWFLTLWAYAVYAARPSAARYLIALLAFALGLMSKPMLVTVPCVLLLLDFWPLRRLRLISESGPWLTEAGARGLWRQIKDLSPVHPGKLILEKVPFLVMALISSAITFVGVYTTNRVLSVDSVPLGFRLANVPVSYVRYLGKMILPENMVVLYPMPARWETWQVAGSLLVLTVLSALVVALMRRAPYLLVGWLWYLGTLVPTIGIIPVGFHSIADRYTYVPLVGVFIMVTWAVADLSASWPYRRRLLTAATVVVLAALAFGTWRQARHWRDNRTLFSHAVNVSTNNALAHHNLGLTLQLEGRWGEAIKHYREAARIQPGDMKPRINLGYLLNQVGLHDQASNELAEVIRRTPDEATARLHLGVALSSLGHFDEAMAQWDEALRLQPDLGLAWYQKGLACEKERLYAKAIENYHEAVTVKSDLANAWLRLAWLRGAHPDPAIRDPDRALAHARRVCEITGQKDAAALLSLAVAQAGRGDFAAARRTVADAEILAKTDGTSRLIEQCREVADAIALESPYEDRRLVLDESPVP